MSLRVIDELVAQMHPAALPDFTHLVTIADLEAPIVLTEDELAEAVRPFALLLELVGDGIRLTAAGYLPPTLVERLMIDLGWMNDWIGKGNREDLTPHVATLRALAQHTRLVRVQKGMLLPSPAGRKARASAGELWAQLAGRVLRHDGTAEATAREILMIWIASRNLSGSDEFSDHVARSLATVGWVSSEQRVVSRSTARMLIDPALDVLGLLGGLDGRRHRGAPTDVGVAFARSALQAKG